MFKDSRCIRKKVTFTFANGVSGAGLIQSAPLALEGELLWIHQRNSSNTNSVTAKLTIEDEDSYQIFDGTAKAHNANYDHEFGVSIRRILVNKGTLKCTISGDPGASGYTIDAVLHLVGRDHG